MSANTLPLRLGQVSTSGDLARLLGQAFRVDDPDGVIGTRVFVLVKAAAQITSPARKAVKTALSSGAPTWNVDTTTTASDVGIVVIPSDYTATIASGDYFLAQAKGYAEVISAAAIAANAVVGTSTTAGKCDDATISGSGIIGYALESAAGGDENVSVFLSGASVGL